MGNEDKLGEGVRAVDRALAILLAFTPQDSELSALELAKRVGLSRPTLYRILYTLEKQGFIFSAGEPQRFRLGSAVAKLAHVWTSSLDVSRVAQAILHRLWEASGETVALFVPQGALRVCIAELPCAQPLSFKRGVGYSEAIALGASGRAILAFLDATRGQIEAYAAASGMDAARFIKELPAIRKRGFAHSQNELIQGAVAVAAPFFDRHGQVAGSIGVFGPYVRIDAKKIEDFGRLVVAEGANLSRELGHVPPA